MIHKSTATYQVGFWADIFFYWVFIEHIIPCCKAQCIMQIISTLSLWLPCKSISILTRRKPEQMLTFWPRGSGHKCRLLNQELHCAMHVSDSLGRLSSLLLSERTRSLPQAYILWPFILTQCLAGRNGSFVAAYLSIYWFKK